jgi:hypothetical protein
MIVIHAMRRNSTRLLSSLMAWLVGLRVIVVMGKSRKLSIILTF